MVFVLRQITKDKLKPWCSTLIQKQMVLLLLEEMAHYLRSANQLTDTFFILPTWNIGYPVYKDTGRPGDLTVGVLDSKSRGPGLGGHFAWVQI